MSEQRHFATDTGTALHTREPEGSLVYRTRLTGRPHPLTQEGRMR